jgi:gluconate kinase
MGVGKNYVGERLAESLECKFLDGDIFVPKKMANKVARFSPLSQEDIDNYITEHLIPGIEKHLQPQSQSQPQQDLVVAQALYRKEHRDQIQRHFGQEENCKFILITAPLLTNLKRLLKRDKGFRWVVYALLNRPFFQSEGIFKTICNDGKNLSLWPRHLPQWSANS